MFQQHDMARRHLHSPPRPAATPPQTTVWSTRDELLLAFQADVPGRRPLCAPALAAAVHRVAPARGRSGHRRAQRRRPAGVRWEARATCRPATPVTATHPAASRWPRRSNCCSGWLGWTCRRGSIWRGKWRRCHQRLAWGAHRRVLQLDGMPGVPRRVQSEVPSPEQLAALALGELSLELGPLGLPPHPRRPLQRHRGGAAHPPVSGAGGCALAGRRGAVLGLVSVLVPAF